MDQRLWGCIRQWEKPRHAGHSLRNGNGDPNTEELIRAGHPFNHFRTLQFKQGCLDIFKTCIGISFKKCWCDKNGVISVWDALWLDGMSDPHPPPGWGGGSYANDAAWSPDQKNMYANKVRLDFEEGSNES